MRTLPTCRGLVAALTVVVCLSVAVAGAAPSLLSVTEALTLYDRGRYVEFFDAANRDGAVDHTLFGTFSHDADRWISSATPPERERRRLVAATVALELAHHFRDQPAERAGNYLLWASRLMQETPPLVRSSAERLWYLASIAGMEELYLDAWGLTVGAEHQWSPAFQLQAWAIGRGGQAAIALHRFPDEPRFRLTQLE